MKLILRILPFLIAFSTTLSRPLAYFKEENNEVRTIDYELLWPDVTIKYSLMNKQPEPRPMTYTSASVSSTTPSMVTTTRQSTTFTASTTSRTSTSLFAYISSTNKIPPIAILNTENKSHLINIICNSCNNLVINNHFV